MNILTAVLSLSLLVKPGASQQYGNGFGKSTWRSSDAAGTYAWLQKHLPVVQDHPNGAVQCGEVPMISLRRFQVSFTIYLLLVSFAVKDVMQSNVTCIKLL